MTGHFLALLGVLSCTLAGASDQPAHITLGDGGATGPIGKHILLLEDPYGGLSPDQALRNVGYVLQQDEVPNLGLGRSTYWLRFVVANETDGENAILHFANPDVDELDVYRIDAGSPVLIARAGLSQPTGSRLDGGKELVFDLGVPTASSSEVLVRVKSLKQLRIPLVIRSSKEQLVYDKGKDLAIGLYVGIMLVMALYNLFVYFSTKDKSYLTYVSYILLVCITQINFVGFGNAYLWPEFPWWSVNASLILTLLTAIAASEFLRGFIRLRRTAPKFDKVLPYFYAYFVVCVTAYMNGSEILGYTMTQIGAGLFATYLLITLIHTWRKGSREAGFFLIAWCAFLMGTVVFVLKDIGVLPYTDWSVYAMPIGSAVEGVLLSLALADRINILRREKEQSQAEALHASLENERIIREQNVMLEEKVTERTHALQESNEHLKQTQTQLVNAEKMASLGQLTAGIAHEINNPINFITSNIDPLKRNISEIVEVMQNYRTISEDRIKEDLLKVRELEVRLDIQESINELDDIIGSISEGSSRTAEIVRGLRNFSRLDEDDLKFTDLNEGIRSTLTLLSPQFRHKVSIELDLGDTPEVECFPGKVNQVFMNVITNGIQAAMAQEDGRKANLLITTRKMDDRVHIRIKDNGVGMSEEVKARIYDPFFTTKAVGEGTGLGLAIVYGIVEDHQGRISVESAPGSGTEFLIDLPVHHARLNQRRA
jgi:hypothetical protein